MHAGGFEAAFNQLMFLNIPLLLPIGGRFSNHEHLCYTPFFSPSVPLHDLAESWDERLRKPETEDQLRPSHQHLWYQTLEERSGTLMLSHIRNDPEARLWVLEIAVLYPSLDDVQGCRNNQRRRRTHYRRDKVLAPRRLVVVFEMENLLLRPCATTEQRERARRVTCRRPPCTSVQAHTFVCDDLEEPARPECLWVCLALDLEHVEGQENNLANTDERASGSIEHSFSCAFAERFVEVGRVVLCQVVTHEWLSAILVYSLENLVACSIAETGE